MKLRLPVRSVWYRPPLIGVHRVISGTRGISRLKKLPTRRTRPASLVDICSTKCCKGIKLINLGCCPSQLHNVVDEVSKISVSHHRSSHATKFWCRFNFRRSSSNPYYPWHPRWCNFVILQVCWFSTLLGCGDEKTVDNIASWTRSLSLEISAVAIWPWCIPFLRSTTSVHLIETSGCIRNIQILYIGKCPVLLFRRSHIKQ